MNPKPKTTGKTLARRRTAGSLKRRVLLLACDVKMLAVGALGEAMHHKAKGHRHVEKEWREKYAIYKELAAKLDALQENA